MYSSNDIDDVEYRFESSFGSEDGLTDPETECKGGERCCNMAVGCREGYR